MSWSDEAAESETERIRRAAEEEARQYLAQAQRRVDAWAADRIARLDELTGAIARLSDELRDRMVRTIDVRAQLDGLVEALGAAATQAAAEVALPAPELGGIGGQSRRPMPFPMRPAGDAEVPPEPPRADDTA